MPANLDELIEYVNNNEDDWTRRDTLVSHLSAQFGDLIFYGPDYNRATWEHVADYICTGDTYWLDMAKACAERVRARRAAKK